MIQSLQDYLQSTGFIWADKMAVLASFLLFILFLVFWSLAFLVVGSLGAEHLWRNLGMVAVERCISIVLLAWFAMRGADFLAGEPAHRLIGFLRSASLHSARKSLPNWRRSEQH